MKPPFQLGRMRWWWYFAAGARIDRLVAPNVEQSPITPNLLFVTQQQPSDCVEDERYLANTMHRFCWSTAAVMVPWRLICSPFVPEDKIIVLWLLINSRRRRTGRSGSEIKRTSRAKRWLVAEDHGAQDTIRQELMRLCGAVHPLWISHFELLNAGTVYYGECERLCVVYAKYVISHRLLWAKMGHRPAWKQNLFVVLWNCLNTPSSVSKP